MPKPPLAPEKEHVVVNEGPNKGERYDNAPDFEHSVKNDADKFKTNVMNMYRDQAPEPDKGKITDQWYADWDKKTSPETKKHLQSVFDRRETNKILADSYEKPENKAKILANMRRNPFYRQFSDDELWGQLNLQNKKYYFNLK